MTGEPIALTLQPDESGTDVIAFLFSDIVGSTRRWEGDEAAMAADLDRHDDLLGGIVAEAGGEVFTHTGDGMAAAFTNPASALQAAVEIQRTLAATMWVGPAPLRVRIAIHAGPAHRRDGNYFGPTLNRAARLMSVGNGGQVLCSGRTARLLGAEPMSDVTLVDLGEHRLADLTVPERVFQVQHAALPTDFPPLRTLRAQRHNLPVVLANFVGRAVELDALAQLVGARRLVTVTGVGGGGKTRLALEVAAGALDDYDDGAWLVDFVPVRDGALVPHALATALGVETTGYADTERLTDHLVAHLASKRMLLVFDNCEHLVDDIAALAHRIVTGAEHVALLATSREPLGLPGETVWRMPPLSLPPIDSGDPAELVHCDSVTLFRDRARAAQPNFEITPTNIGAVAAICRRLDGIPLALELAAARTRVLGVRQIADRLDDTFRLLAGDRRSSAHRHQTLRATLDWSFDALTPIEQLALRRLGVFSSSFDLEAAAAVIGEAFENADELDALDLLACLVDKSFVLSLADFDEMRYRLLEPVRQYAMERLVEAGEGNAARRRHCDFFAGLRRTWRYTIMPPERMARVALDHDNMRSALEWAWAEGDAETALRLVSSLWLSWFFGGEPDAIDWVERVLDATEPTADPARIEVSFGLVMLLSSAGRSDPERFDALTGEAIRLASETGDPRIRAVLDFSLSEGALASGHIDEAAQLINAALATFEAVSTDDAVGWCHDHLGWICAAQQDFVGARHHFELATDIARAHDPEWLAAHAIAGLGAVVALSGDGTLGLSLAEEAVSAARRLPLDHILVMTLARAAQTSILAGADGRAVEILTELFDRLATLGTRRWVCDALEMLAVTRVHSGALADGTALFATCDALRDSLGESQSGMALLADDINACRAATPPDGAPSPAVVGISIAMALAQGLGMAQCA